MMVETMLESSQDFNGAMSGAGGALPQWKRELLQRRAARARPAPPAPPPPPPPAPPLEDEELRYGPGIVKRLKSRYLSLALRDAPRRRPSVLRRATSLEQLLDERPPPAPRPAARPPRPASLAATATAPHHPAPRRDFVKRARSVDALSRLESRDEPPPSPPPPPPPRPAARPPRRPAPLLRDAERPPPDLVRSTLRKFEPAPVRRAAPAARVSAALRGLERGRSPSPMGGEATPDEPEGVAVSAPRAVSRAALEGIARAGSSTRYSFEAARRGSHLPPLAATNPVLLGRARRVGVIRPMPAPAMERAVSAPLPVAELVVEKVSAVEPCGGPAVDPEPTEEPPRPASPARPEPEPAPRLEKRSPPPSALVEPIPRSPPDEPPPPPPLRSPPPPIREPSPEMVIEPERETSSKSSALVNGHTECPRTGDVKTKEPEVERPWNGVSLKRAAVSSPSPRRSPRGAAPATSVVFNFSHRAHVPDYIENDGLILRASRRDRLKAGEPGVVLLPGAAGAGAGSGGEEEEGEDEAGPPSPCDVRFYNDNVLINGRSSIMPTAARRDHTRIARLKLQFDDSLTRTFEYPSETSLCEEEDPACPSPSPAPAPATAAGALGANTHLVSAALSRYTPSKTSADLFQLGVTRHAPPPPRIENGESGAESAEAAGASETDARPCGADAARSWSDARSLATDLLF